MHASAFPPVALSYNGRMAASRMDGQHCACLVHCYLNGIVLLYNYNVKTCVFFKSLGFIPMYCST